MALCINNTGYQASLIVGKMYRLILDARALKDDFLRVIDESGEDYLYHSSFFTFLDIPRPIEKNILALASRAAPVH